MKLQEVMLELENLASEQTKKTFLNHGAKGELFGVKVGDLKTLVKKIKKNHELSLELFKTKNCDAQYLAGLIADEKKITNKDLQQWAKSATWHMISEYTVAWIAAESNHGFDLARQWIDDKNEAIASSGWSTWSNLCLIKADVDFDKKELKKLIDHVIKNIHQSPNRVRYTMNGFIMSCGQCIDGMYDDCLKAATKIGNVEVFLGKTACKVPDATEYLPKMKAGNYLGKKKKQARC